MADYNAPLRDMRFVLNEVFEVSKLWAQLPALAEVVDEDTAAAILEEAGKVTGGVIAPLNRRGDEEGCSWTDGGVKTPAGFPQAYQTYAEGGWVGVGGDPVFGGMGMPKVISAQVEEMVNSANLSFGLYPMLTAGACLSINAHASEELKEKYLPNMYSGVWAGSMCLTEPHAGTDLGIIRTKAEPQADGSFKITGTKIFITGGEHDLTRTSSTWYWPSCRTHRLARKASRCSWCRKSWSMPTVRWARKTRCPAAPSNTRWASRPLPPA